MQNRRPFTKEYAKNPNPPMEVECSKCKYTAPLKDMMREEQMPEPYQTTVEGFLLCPQCGQRSHCYYMTESLRFNQEMLAKALARWHREKSDAAWREYERRQRVFQNNFDTVQKRYKGLLEKEAEDGQSDA